MQLQPSVYLRSLLWWWSPLWAHRCRSPPRWRLGSGTRRPYWASGCSLWPTWIWTWLWRSCPFDPAINDIFALLFSAYGFSKELAVLCENHTYNWVLLKCGYLNGSAAKILQIDFTGCNYLHFVNRLNGFNHFTANTQRLKIKPKKKNLNIHTLCHTPPNNGTIATYFTQFNMFLKF